MLQTSGDAELVEIGEDMAAWLKPDGAGTLCQALGLGTPQSSRSWRTLVAQAERDHLLRETAQRFDLSAGEMADQLAAYAARHWPKEAALAQCPLRHQDKPAAFFWAALRAWPRTVGRRQVETILQNEQAGLISRDS